MLYFWIVPIFLALVIALWLFFTMGTKRTTSGESRLDQARRDD